MYVLLLAFLFLKSNLVSLETKRSTYNDLYSNYLNQMIQNIWLL